MATNKKFLDYMKSNKSSIDVAKLKSMDKVGQLAAIKEMQTNYLSKGNVGDKYTIKKDNPKIITNDTKNNLGDVSDSNIMVAKLDATGKAYEDNQNKAATNLDTAQFNRANQEKGYTEQADAGARKRYDEQQALLDKQKSASEGRVEERRKDADSLLARQEAIAARQANIAAAQGGESGLQLSQGAVQEIKDDIISKYGQNLANAEQFRLQTNMSLDDALTKLDDNFFSNKQQIGELINKLDQNEMAPLINATKAALEGDKTAINSIKDYYAGLINKKSEEEYNRTSELERIEDSQRIWTGLDQRQKGDKLSDDVGAENKWVMDVYWGNPDAFKNMSYTEAVSTLQKVAKQVASRDAVLETYLKSKGDAALNGIVFKEDPKMEAEIKRQFDLAKLSDYSQEHKTEERGTTGTKKTNLTTKVPGENIVTKLTTAQTSAIDKELQSGKKQDLISLINKKMTSGQLSTKNGNMLLDYINTK